MSRDFSSFVKRGASRRAVAAAMLAASVAIAASNTAFAARTSEFGVNIFNTSVEPVALSNAVFSPIAFELDCAVFAEACDPISRANTAEALGVLTELLHFYQPIYQRLSAPTNGYSFVTARAWCLPDIRLAYIEFRKRIWERCGAAVCSSFPPKGAERFLLSMMDGEMEDFCMPLPSFAKSHYSYFDLVSEKVTITTNAMPQAQIRTGEFHKLTGEVSQVPFLYCNRANVDYCRSQYWQIVRLELEGGAWLYLVRPAENFSFVDMRHQLTPAALYGAMSSVLSLTEKDAGSAYCELSFPLIDMTGETDLAAGFRLALVPSQGFDFIDRSLTTRHAKQRARVRISPPKATTGDAAQSPETEKKAAGEEEEDASSVAAYDPSAQWRVAKEQWQAPRKNAGVFDFSSPFLFMIYHPELDIVTSIGQYMGL